jgi:hypothetical protein
MSEYEYYEFAAIDGPISDEGMAVASGGSANSEFDTPIARRCCAGSKNCDYGTGTDPNRP